MGGDTRRYRMDGDVGEVAGPGSSALVDTNLSTRTSCARVPAADGEGQSSADTQRCRDVWRERRGKREREAEKGRRESGGEVGRWLGLLYA